MTPKAKQNVLRMETQAKFPYLIRIEHEEYGSFYFANCDTPVAFKNDVYKPCFFSVDRGEKREGEVANASLTLSTVDQEWIVRIRQTQKRANLFFVACIVYEDDGSQYVEAIEEEKYTLAEVSWTDTSLTWEMIFDDTMEILIPCDVSTASKNPAVW